MISAKQISVVQFKPATPFFLGYIQLSVGGELATTFSKPTIIGTARNKDIAKDENAILFSRGDSHDFKVIANAITGAVTT